MSPVHTLFAPLHSSEEKTLVVQEALLPDTDNSFDLIVYKDWEWKSIFHILKSTDLFFIRKE